MDSTELSVAKSSARSTEKQVESMALHRTVGPISAPKTQIDSGCITHSKTKQLIAVSLNELNNIGMIWKQRGHLDNLEILTQWIVQV
jgi:hypothetical protein